MPNSDVAPRHNSHSIGVHHIAKFSLAGKRFSNAGCPDILVGVCSVAGHGANSPAIGGQYEFLSAILFIVYR